MILRRHFPGPALMQYVAFLWYYQDWRGDHTRERVLPDASFELVINLNDTTRKLFDRDGSDRYIGFKGGWLSGAHSRYIVIDAVPGTSMIGVHFKPGGIRPFVGPSAAEFQDYVVEMDQLWGGSARQLREQLVAGVSPEAKFEALEQFLVHRLARCGLDQSRRERMVWASRQLGRQRSVGAIGRTARVLGVSHKQFITQFREAVGLTPKVFCRIRRFQEALTALQDGRRVRWAEVACDCGYYDQSHLIREFQEFAGLNPSDYRNLSAEYASFVPVDGLR
jgi:AraC-like DNA-binding protein